MLQNGKDKQTTNIFKLKKRKMASGFVKDVLL